MRRILLIMAIRVRLTSMFLTSGNDHDGYIVPHSLSAKGMDDYNVHVYADFDAGGGEGS